MRKISVFLAILLICLLLFFKSAYRLPVFEDDDKFSYIYVFLNPFNTDEVKVFSLLQKFSDLRGSETEIDNKIIFQKIVVQDNILRIYLSGVNLASSSYNEIRIIEQIRELIRINFDYIEKMVIIDDAKIFKHIDVRFPIIIEK